MNKNVFKAVVTGYHQKGEISRSTFSLPTAFTVAIEKSVSQQGLKPVYFKIRRSGNGSVSGVGSSINSNVILSQVWQ